MNFKTNSPSYQKAIFLLITVVLWLILFRSNIQWIIQALFQEEYTLHAVLLLAVSVYVLSKVKQKKIILNEIRYRTLPCVITLPSIGVYLYNDAFIHIDIVSTLCLVSGTFGISGLFLSPKAWMQKLPIFALFACIVPVSYHVETFAGFPMRVLAANIVSKLYQSLGIDAVTTNSIILIENQRSNVDLPCSGIKSLWIGVLFFLTLSYIEHWKISIRWLILFALTLVLIIAANLLRITCLVTANYLHAPELLQEIIHIPVGMVGFVGSCLCIFYLGKKFNHAYVLPPIQKPLNTDKTSISHYFILWGVLLISIGLQVFSLQPSTPKYPMPAVVQTPHSLALTDKEKTFFLNQGVTEYQKSKLHINELTGSVFLVKTRSWRGHHHPEQCLKGNGHSIKNSATFFIKPNFPIKVVQLKNNNRMAAYWFVSKQHTIDDFSLRVWKGLFKPSEPWVMVSIYFDHPIELNSESFLNTVQKTQQQAKYLLHSGNHHE